MRKGEREDSLSAGSAAVPTAAGLGQAKAKSGSPRAAWSTLCGPAPPPTRVWRSRAIACRDRVCRSQEWPVGGVPGPTVLWTRICWDHAADARRRPWGTHSAGHGMTMGPATRSCFRPSSAGLGPKARAGKGLLPQAPLPPEGHRPVGWACSMQDHAPSTPNIRLPAQLPWEGHCCESSSRTRRFPGDGTPGGRISGKGCPWGLRQEGGRHEWSWAGPQASAPAPEMCQAMGKAGAGGNGCLPTPPTGWGV